MTIYLPNTALHETGAEVDEFIDVSIPDPPPPPDPPHDRPLGAAVRPRLDPSTTSTDPSRAEE